MRPRSLSMRLPAELLLGLGVILGSARGSAQVPVSATVAATTDESGEAGARKHFNRALELYRGGLYVEALAELEHAATLDPDGKDLFFNLALVHEKLGQLPEAVAALERFRELETDPVERERARVTVERLHGAQQAAEVAPRASSACAESAPPQPVARAPNSVLIGTASVSLVSLVVGAVFGAKALSDDVSHAKTSAGFSAVDLRERGQRAEREALVADIAFSVGVAAGATFATVWLLSPGEPAKRSAGITLRSYF